MEPQSHTTAPNNNSTSKETVIIWKVRLAGIVSRHQANVWRCCVGLLRHATSYCKARGQASITPVAANKFKRKTTVCIGFQEYFIIVIQFCLIS